MYVWIKVCTVIQVKIFSQTCRLYECWPSGEADYATDPSCPNLLRVVESD